MVACVPSSTTDNAGVEVPFHMEEQEVVDVLSADYGDIGEMEAGARGKHQQSHCLF